MNPFMLCFFCADNPGNVTLNVNNPNNTFCAGTTLKFTCTADANPRAHTYTLYENGVGDADMNGVWMRQLNTDGLFNYSYRASNSLGTNFTSSNTTFTVQGKLTSLMLLQILCNFVVFLK